MVASRQKLIISSWAIMSTAGNNHWKLFVCYLRIKSNTRKTSLSCVGTTSVLVSIESMDFMMNVSGMGERDEDEMREFYYYRSVNCYSNFGLFLVMCCLVRLC